MDSGTNIEEQTAATVTVEVLENVVTRVFRISAIK